MTFIDYLEKNANKNNHLPKREKSVIENIIKHPHSIEIINPDYMYKSVKLPPNNFGANYIDIVATTNSNTVYLIDVKDCDNNQIASVKRKRKLINRKLRQTYVIFKDNFEVACQRIGVIFFPPSNRIFSYKSQVPPEDYHLLHFHREKHIYKPTPILSQ